VLLFGKEPQRFYPSALVKIGRFRSPTLIVDDREVDSTLFDQIEGTMSCSPLRLEDLKQVHPSVLRNRKIAEMFFYIGWIEQWGRGIQKILDECAAAGLPEPEFEEKTGGLWLTFRKDILTEEHLRSRGLNERNDMPTPVRSQFPFRYPIAAHAHCWAGES